MPLHHIGLRIVVVKVIDQHDRELAYINVFGFADLEVVVDGSPDLTYHDGVVGEHHIILVGFKAGQDGVLAFLVAADQEGYGEDQQLTGERHTSFQVGLSEQLTYEFSSPTIFKEVLSLLDLGLAITPKLRCPTIDGVVRILILNILLRDDPSQHLQEEDLQLIIQLAGIMDVHVDDVLDELLQRNDREVRTVDLLRYIIDLVQLLAHLDELLLHETLEPRTQIQRVDQPTMLLIQHLIDILLHLLLLLLLQEHLL